MTSVRGVRSGCGSKRWTNPSGSATVNPPKHAAPRCRDGPRIRRRGEDRRRLMMEPRSARRRPAPRRQRSPRTRTQASRQRDVVLAVQGERRQRLLHPRRDARHGAGDQIAAVGRELVLPFVLPGDLGRRIGVERDDVPDVEGQTERVEPRAEVGRGCRHGDGEAHDARSLTRRRGEAELFGHDGGVRGHGHRMRRAGDGPFGILEPVPGQDADNRRTRRHASLLVRL